MSTLPEPDHLPGSEPGSEAGAEPGFRPEHFDVLIIGAGLAGIGAACHLQTECPGLSYAILEARESSGGTWDLFRYPGIRSDSDMFTLGYAFRPWTRPSSIADGGSILSYVRDTARQYGVDQRIRFRHRVVHASWSASSAHWSVEVESRAGPSGTPAQTVRLTCGFLFSNTGYYRYDEGYTPHFEGVERFGGQIVHPQHWPADLDCTGKRVVVIGSGATAVTLVPALAADAAHVTLLQRSPSYVVSMPARDRLGDLARRRLPAPLAARVVRVKNILRMGLSYQFSRRAPEAMKAILRKGVARQLPPGYPVETHFAPSYQPWDQRLCVVPDGDLFRAIQDGDASMVTAGIETFTEQGLRLTSGVELEADVIVTATGLNLLMLGGMGIDVDGRKIDLSRTVGYKGIMLSGIPNFAVTIGYTNASWTLKADLAAHYVCRLLHYLREHQYRQCTPRAPDPSRPTRPLIDLTSGYVLRSVGTLPRQGSSRPWRQYQNYPLDLLTLKYGSLDDEMDFA